MPLTADNQPFSRASATTMSGTSMRHFWALCIARRSSSPMFSLQRLHECLRLLQIRRVKAFGEPTGDRPQQLAGFGALALLLPQVAQTGGRAQLPRLGLLAAGDREGLLEAGFDLGCIRDSLAQQQGTLEAIRLCQHVGPPAG